MVARACLILVALLVVIDGSAVPTKWHQHYFSPRFRTALGDIRNLVSGSQGEVRVLLEHIEKANFLSKLIHHKIVVIIDWLKWFNTNPYECTVEGAELLSANGMCYYLETVELLTFPAARQWCIKKGGDLAMPIKPDNADIIAFWKDTLLSGFLGKTENTVTVYLGGTNNKNAISAKYFNGYDLGFVDDAVTGALTLVAPITTGLTLMSKGDEDTAKRGFICEFMAMPKDPALDFKNSHYQSVFEDYAANDVDVEFHDYVAKACGDERIAVGELCYEYFGTPKLFAEAKMFCSDDGGQLASPSLLPDSLFGGLLASALEGIVASGTELWIHADPTVDGVERVTSTKRNIGSDEDETSARAKGQPTNPEAAARDDSFELVLTLPPVANDNAEWDVEDVTGLTERHAFVCEYHPVHHHRKRMKLRRFV